MRATKNSSSTGIKKGDSIVIPFALVKFMILATLCKCLAVHRMRELVGGGKKMEVPESIFV